MIIVFAGPTVTPEAVAGVVRADVRPPAARGDVYRAAKCRPAAIGIVDGTFDGTPSIWHKEILWAMAQGIHVFGAASLGALRAAELHAFGMTGVGAIFEDFLYGRLEDDDEVALTHASAEHGYRPTSEAMVNIRATLGAARKAGVVSVESAAALERLAKGWPYPERRFEAILASARDVGVSDDEVRALSGWLRGGRVDQKGADALEMLRRMAEHDARGWGPKRVSYRMEPTDAWACLVRATPSGPDAGGGPAAEELIDELLLRGEAGATWDAAFARATALRLADALRVELDPRAIASVADDFRRERGLLSSAQFTEWLRAQHIADTQVDDFFRREATVRAILGEPDASVAEQLIDTLRSKGTYQELVARARAKQKRLECAGGRAASAAAGPSSDAELGRWLADAASRRFDDVEQLARSQRSTVVRLRAAAAREKLFLSMTEQAEFLGGESEK